MKDLHGGGRPTAPREGGWSAAFWVGRRLGVRLNSCCGGSILNIQNSPPTFPYLLLMQEVGSDGEAIDAVVI